MRHSPVEESLKRMIHIKRDVDTPVYLQIANALIQNIRTGRIRKGIRLPGTRELAGLLNIHRITAAAAYDELAAQGWIEIRPRKGSFVAQLLPEVRPDKFKEANTSLSYPAKCNFALSTKHIPVFPGRDFPTAVTMVINDGFPDTRLAPVDLLFRRLRSQAQMPVFKKYYQYGSAKGATILCDTLAGYLGDTRGLPITAENILITKGAQMALYLTAVTVLKPGDEVVVGEPGYLTATLTFQQTGANINPVRVDEYGINTDDIEKLCRTKKIRLVYVISHHHHPTTVTLIPERRMKLLQLAAKYRFVIVEDDYDYDFRYSSKPLLPLASLDISGNVVYVGTLTKTLIPSIRLGFVIGPADFICALTDMRRLVDWQGDSIMEAAIADLYKYGIINRHIKKVVKIYHDRRDHFCELLQKHIARKINFRIPDGGMAVWTHFRNDDVSKIAARAAKKGLQMNDGSTYNRFHNYNSVRLGFASLDFKEQAKAIKILAECMT